MPFEPYLNVAEIESAMEDAAINHSSLCTLITLPNPTYLGKTCHAIKLAAGTLTSRPGVLLLGGTHAREWGGSDILIAFMENILAAYDGATGLTFQGKSYTAAEIKRVMEFLELFIVPDVNPDGKEYCQTVGDWRKNRRPVGSSIGIDINRNYDFLWDASVYFDPSLHLDYLYNPSSTTYHGTSPFSEAESQNIKWLADTYPNIAYSVDIHSAGQKIMYVWEDDENQSSDPALAFNNPVYDGQRGLSGDAYGEFIFDFDHQKVIRTASRIYDALFAVRGKSYTIGQVYDQVGLSCGSSACYMFSRHSTNPAYRKVLGFGIEFGQIFQPAPAEMKNIIDDVGAALTELCLCASEPDLYIRDSLADAGVEPSSGGLSASPDIIVRKSAVADPGAEFGDITVEPSSDTVEIGNDNFIYVRVHNRGGQASDGVVRLYAAPLTTTCAPSLWNFIDEVDIPGIPAYGFKVSDAVTWPDVADPGTGNHFCIVAVCGNTGDPFPDVSMIDSSGDFIKFMRNCNNIAYRNLTFENVLPDGWGIIPFVMKGFHEKRPEYHLKLDAAALPLGSSVELRTRKRWLAAKTVKLEAIKKIAAARTNQESRLRVGAKYIGIVHNLRIPGAVTPLFHLHIRISAGAKHGDVFPVRIIQYRGLEEMGRITVMLRCLHRDKTPYFVSRADGHVHRAGCDGVRKTSAASLIPYPDLESARRDGHELAPDCLGMGPRK